MTNPANADEKTVYRLLIQCILRLKAHGGIVSNEIDQRLVHPVALSEA